MLRVKLKSYWGNMKKNVSGMLYLEVVDASYSNVDGG
jgi:hypothetical protein